MDFLEDLLDFGDRKRRQKGGLFQNDDHHDDDNHHDHHDAGDDHDHHQQYTNNPFTQVPTNPAAIPSGIVCRKCSSPTLQGAKFCHKCGAAIDLIQKCASCGSKVPANAPFCPQCGYNNG
jgi:ribosomal protein L40E